MIVLLIALILLTPTSAFSHGGAIDSYGCHNNTKLGVYECHHGVFANKTWNNPGGKEAMLKELENVIKPPTETHITGTATLTWEPVTHPKLSGYKMYWRLVGGQWQDPIVVGLTEKLELGCILKGAIYEFAVTAFTPEAESELSNIVSKSFK